MDYLVRDGLDVCLFLTFLPLLVTLNHTSYGAGSNTLFLRGEDNADLVAGTRIVASMIKVFVSDPSTCGHELDFFLEVVEDEGIVHELEELYLFLIQFDLRGFVV